MKQVAIIFIFMLWAMPGFSQIPNNVLKVFNENRVDSWDKVIAIQDMNRLYFFVEGEYKVICTMCSEKELSGKLVALIAEDYYTKLMTEQNSGRIEFIYMKGKKKNRSRGNVVQHKIF